MVPEDTFGPTVENMKAITEWTNDMVTASLFYPMAQCLLVNGRTTSGMVEASNQLPMVDREKEHGLTATWPIGLLEYILMFKKVDRSGSQYDIINVHKGNDWVKPFSIYYIMTLSLDLLTDTRYLVQIAVLKSVLISMGLSLKAPFTSFFSICNQTNNTSFLDQICAGKLLAS
jgi:hypothetical protein